jgi:hypothetical protein
MSELQEMPKPKRRNRLIMWRVALLSTATYYPIFFPAYYPQQVFSPVTIRGGDWGDIVFEGMRG